MKAFTILSVCMFLMSLCVKAQVNKTEVDSIVSARVRLLQDSMSRLHTIEVMSMKKEADRLAAEETHEQKTTVADLARIQDMIANLGDADSQTRVGDIHYIVSGKIKVHFEGEPTNTADKNETDRFQKGNKGRKIEQFKNENVEKDPKAGKDSITIDKVFIRWKDGFIIDMYVNASNHVKFINMKPFALTSYTISSERSRLYVPQSGVGAYINLNEIVRLDRLNDYVPNDGQATFLVSPDSVSLIKSTSVDSQVKVRLFTDGLAAFGDQPNGLAQTELNFKHNTGRTTLLQRRAPAVFAKYLKVNVTASKFDSRFAYASVDTNATRSDIWQRNYFNASARATILDLWLAQGSSSSLYLDFGVGSHLAKGARTLDSTRTDSITIISSYLMGELGFDFEISDRWHAGLFLNTSWQSIPQLRDLKTSDANFHKSRTFYKPQFILCYQPSTDGASELFVRFTYNTVQFERAHNFFQFQIGYSISFTQLVKGETDQQSD